LHYLQPRFFRHKHEGYKFSGEKHSSKIGQHFKPWLDIIETKYSGDWNVKGGRLYKGENLINNDSLILDAIKEKPEQSRLYFLEMKNCHKRA